MPISFDDIELAFLFVSSDMKNMNNAFVCRETGEIFHTSETGDSDEFGELPEDIGDSKKYISIPHKNDLELGKTLVLQFTSEYLPEEPDRVHAIFRRKGAYARYKDLLYEKGRLDEWHDFENEHQQSALKEWLRENNIETED